VLVRAKIDLGCESTVRTDLPVAAATGTARSKVLVTTPGLLCALAVDGAISQHMTTRLPSCCKTTSCGIPGLLRLL
jgi:hypothetical protein